MTRRWTAAEIDAERTPRGGWSRESFKRMGVPYPPPKGWRSALLAGTSPGGAARSKRTAKASPSRPDRPRTMSLPAIVTGLAEDDPAFHESFDYPPWEDAPKPTDTQRLRSILGEGTW